PELPNRLMLEVEPYTNAREASFMGWLADGAMLVATRFANVSQIHKVERPLGMREQLTFGSQPAVGATARPHTDHFVFARDMSGSQLYEAVLVTDSGSKVISEPGTRNQSFVFSPDGGALAWAQLTPGDPNYDLMWLLPEEPSSPRVVFEG